MAAITQQRLIFSFKNAEGKTVSFTLDDPTAGLTGAEVETVMDLLISKNLFATTGGSLVSKQDIRLVDTSTTDLYDPA